MFEFIVTESVTQDGVSMDFTPMIGVVCTSSTCASGATSPASTVAIVWNAWGRPSNFKLEAFEDYTTNLFTGYVFPMNGYMLQFSFDSSAQTEQIASDASAYYASRTGAFFIGNPESCLLIYILF